MQNDNSVTAEIALFSKTISFALLRIFAQRRSDISDKRDDHCENKKKKKGNCYRDGVSRGRARSSYANFRFTCCENREPFRRACSARRRRGLVARGCSDGISINSRYGAWNVWNHCIDVKMPELIRQSIVVAIFESDPRILALSRAFARRWRLIPLCGNDFLLSIYETRYMCNGTYFLTLF